MEDDELHISRIPTAWTMVRDAHRDHTAVQVAQQQLLDRYGGAGRRYALSALRGGGAADDGLDGVSLKFLPGAVADANPERGRVRAFVETIVYPVVGDSQRAYK